MGTRAEGRSIWPALRATLRTTSLYAALLLIPAGLVPDGTWFWTRGLIFVAAVGGVTGAGNLALAIWRPAHFAVRQQRIIAAPEKRQPLADAVGSAIMLTLGAVWLMSIPLDVFWRRWLALPTGWVSLAGGVAVLLGAALTPLAVWENRFATPNVQQQADQTVVRTGVYRLIRHPLYLGNLLLTAGTALWLGSTAGLWGFGVLLIGTIGRIWIEERALQAVPGYADYASQVRARLIPFVV